MLATSHKPFAFKILPVNLYSSKILTGFNAQIFDSIRPGGKGVYLATEASRVFECRRNLHCRNIVSGKGSLQTKFAELCSAGQASRLSLRGVWRLLGGGYNELMLAKNSPLERVLVSLSISSSMASTGESGFSTLRSTQMRVK